jgi:hypothetical protein
MPGLNVIKPFPSSLMKGRNRLEFFVPGKPLQTGVIFKGKARKLPQRGELERYSTQVGSGLILRYNNTKLEKFVKGKRSSLFGFPISIKEKVL